MNGTTLKRTIIFKITKNCMFFPKSFNCIQCVLKCIMKAVANHVNDSSYQKVSDRVLCLVAIWGLCSLCVSAVAQWNHSQAKYNESEGIQLWTVHFCCVAMLVYRIAGIPPGRCSDFSYMFRL